MEPEVRPLTRAGLVRAQRALLRLLAPQGERAEIVADLEEEATQIAAADGRRAAARFVWWQILHSIGPWIGRRTAEWTAVAAGSATHMHHGIWSDVRLGVRRLAHSPGFTLLAIVMLAIGIGAVSTVFSLAHALWLKPLPYADPERLVWIHTRHTPTSAASSLNATELREYTQTGGALAGVAGFTYGAGILRVNGERVRLVAHNVSPNLFRVLGVYPVLGRDFTDADAAPGAKVVMLGYDTWTQRFGGDPGIVGKTMTMNGGAYEVAGVMPRGFAFPRGFEASAWTAAGFRGKDFDRRLIEAVGRLAPGHTIAQASAEVETRARRLAQANPATNGEWTAFAVGAGATATRATRVAFQAMLGLVGLFLLVACTNLAGLLLARNIVRRRELAVRLSIGASRWRLARMLLVESVLLASVGGAAGILLSAYGSRALGRLMPPTTSGLDAIGPNPQVIAVAVGLTILSAALIAFLPAVTLGSLRPAEALAGSRGSTGAVSGTQRALVVAEIVFAVVLVVGAGAMLRSFVDALGRDRGYDPRGLEALNVSLPFGDDAYLDTDRRAKVFGEILDRVSAVPGVRAAAATTGFPGSRLGVLGGGPVTLPEGAAPVMAAIHAASAGYFETMRIPLKRGRAFAPTDTAGAPGVAIVNEELATQFPGGDPIGRVVSLSILGDKATPFEIVGVTGNIRLTGSTGYRIFVPLTQASPYWIDLVVRTDGRQRVAADVRQALRGMNLDLMLENESSFATIISNSLALERTQSGFAIMIGALSSLVAAVGLYALVTFIVAGRRREFGIRLALGSDTRRLFRDALAGPLRLVAGGITIGIAAAVLIVRALGSQVFGLKSADASAYAGAAILVLAISLGASWFPARRVTRTDPLTALRED